MLFLSLLTPSVQVRLDCSSEIIVEFKQMYCNTSSAISPFYQKIIKEDSSNYSIQ